MNQKSPEAFRTISEVADWLGVPTHVLRFWESRFAQVKPVKRAGGRRYYRPSDMMLLGGIRKLLHEDGMTIRGVQKLLREHGVKHVAAMSPPMDLGASVDEAAKDNVVDLSDRRDAREPVEDAQIIEESAAAEDSERQFPFDEEPVPAAPQGAAETEVSEPVVPEAQSADEAEADVPAQAAEPEGESPPEDSSEPDAEESPEATTQETEPSPATAAPELDITDPLPEPEAMDFMAHAAPPDTTEAAPEGPAAPAAKAPPPETAPEDPMSSPEALDFAAHGGEPELAEDDSGTDDSVEPETEEPADAAEETAPPNLEPQPEESPGAEPEPAPALVMPDIDDDPDDDDRESGPLYAADLRRLRATRTELDLAALQALGDRLDEIQRRLAGRDGAAGGL